MRRYPLAHRRPRCRSDPYRDPARPPLARQLCRGADHLDAELGRANFPLTPDDFSDHRLPASIVPFRDKFFGLTIQPERLREIREERRPGSKYATLENCRYEVREAEHLMQQHGISMLDTTTKSIEEIATTVLHRAKLARHIY